MVVLRDPDKMGAPCQLVFDGHPTEQVSLCIIVLLILRVYCLEYYSEY